MLTICWAAKGGSGTTVVAAIRALGGGHALLVDLAGDASVVLGVADDDAAGVHDWLASTAPPTRLAALELAVTEHLALVPAGPVDRPTVAPERWRELAEHLADERRAVVVDVGTRPPPPALLAAADHAWLVTRACYLSLRAAVRAGVVPTGIVLVEEPGRALDADDVAASIGAPVVATVLLDPAVARAVDAGLLVARVPTAYRRAIGRAA